jgi:hypothetical protein
MGKFSRQVRRGLVAGPNRPEFDRSQWEEQARLPDLDQEDQQIIRSGLIFDELLRAARSRKKLQSIPLTPDTLARTAVALVNFNSEYFEAQQKLPAGLVQGTFVTGEIQKVYVRTPAGQDFQPDELHTALGDGLRYLLCDVLTEREPQEKAGSDEFLNVELMTRVAEELKVAVEYDALVDFWQDCAAFNYGIKLNEGALELSPTNPSVEIARIASTYRRLSLALDRSIAFIRFWKHELNRAEREQLCTIRLVSDVTIADDAIEHIDVGRSSRTLRRHSIGAEALLEIQASPYGAFLDGPLPKFGDITLRQLMQAWQFLQSLAQKLHAISVAQQTCDRSFFSYAPAIRGRILTSSLARALGLPQSLGTRLLEALTFAGRRTQELWAQPLVESGADFLLVIPCIHTVHFLRVIETWMRQGGFNLDERGPEFEKYCRDALVKSLRRSPIRDSVHLARFAVRFATASGTEEEIDIVLVVHDTVLLIECKCILWPDESAQFANYRAAVEKATDQIERKRLAVDENRVAFLKALAQLDINPIPPTRVLGCVLTNSAVYAGFSVLGIPIVDLDILHVFLSGAHVSWQVMNLGEVTQEQLIQLYEGPAEAAIKLADFLVDPPQLQRVKASIEPRVVSHELADGPYHSITISTYRVNIDFDAVLRAALEPSGMSD